MGLLPLGPASEPVAEGAATGGDPRPTDSALRTSGHPLGPHRGLPRPVDRLRRRLPPTLDRPDRLPDPQRLHRQRPGVPRPLLRHATGERKPTGQPPFDRVPVALWWTALRLSTLRGFRKIAHHKRIKTAASKPVGRPGRVDKRSAVHHPPPIQATIHEGSQAHDTPISDYTNPAQRFAQRSYSHLTGQTDTGSPQTDPVSGESDPIGSSGRPLRHPARSRTSHRQWESEWLPGNHIKWLYKANPRHSAPTHVSPG